MSNENFDNLSREELIARLTKAENQVEKLFEINKSKDVSFSSACREAGSVIHSLSELIDKNHERYDQFTQKYIDGHISSNKESTESYINALLREGEIFPADKKKLEDIVISASFLDITEGSIYANAIMIAPDTYEKEALKIIERAGRYDPVVHHYDDGRDYDRYPEDPKHKPELFKETVQHFLNITVEDPFSFASNEAEAAKGMGLLSQVLKTKSYEHNYDDEKFFNESLNSIIYGSHLPQCKGVAEIAKQGIIPVDISKLSSKSFIEYINNEYIQKKDGGVSYFNETMNDVIIPIAQSGAFNEELKSGNEGFLHNIKNGLPDNLKPEMENFINDLRSNLEVSNINRNRPKL